MPTKTRRTACTWSHYVAGRMFTAYVDESLLEPAARVPHHFTLCTLLHETLVVPQLPLAVIGWAKFGDPNKTGAFDPSLRHVIGFKQEDSEEYPPLSRKPMPEGDKYKVVTGMEQYGACVLSQTPTPTSETDGSDSDCPIKIPNPFTCCATVATMQAIFATPELVQFLRDMSALPTGDERLDIKAAMDVFIQKVVMNKEIPLVTDTKTLHDAFKARVPEAERRDIYEDATLVIQLALNLAGGFPLPQKKN